jgi:hypothetical protein
LRDAATRIAPALEDDSALRREAARLRPRLEDLVGRRYGRLPRIGYRRGLEARLAGPWSQYLTLGFGPTRVVRITSWETSRPAIPTLLAHELAHRFAFDESVTTLRGLEVSARLAEEGDALHAPSARLELARLAAGAALVRAWRSGELAPIDAFLERIADTAVGRRLGTRWARLRPRAVAGRAPDWALVVYADLPGAALEAARVCGSARAEQLPFPRFALRGPQAIFAWLYTLADAATGRRRAAVPLDATLRLWNSAEA